MKKGGKGLNWMRRGYEVWYFSFLVLVEEERVVV